MKIVLVNWGMIWDGAVNGGGVNGYCQSLALELAQRGHELIYLSGGVNYVPLRLPGPADPAPLTPGPCEVRRHPDWLGVRVFEIINSPVIAPSFHQFSQPQAEVASAELERVVTGFLTLLAPDIVHFHNVEGFTAGCVEAAKVPAAGGGRAKVYYSLHNYHTVCPQVYLMQGHRRPCVDYRNGHACETCIETTPPDAEKLRRMTQYVASLPPEIQRASTPRAPARPQVVVTPPPPRAPLLRQLSREVRALLRAPQPPAPIPPPPPAIVPPPPAPLPVPGVPARSAAEVVAPLPPAGTDARGQTAYLVSERTVHRKLGPQDPEWAPLDNIAAPEPASDLPPSPYATRRAAMIDMLNGCDGVLAVSEFVRRKYEALGVHPARIRTNHIGTRLNRVAALHSDVRFDPPPFDRDKPRPVRLVFIGFNNWYKGLPMFADSLEMLSPEQLSRLHLYIYGLGVGSDEWRFRRMEPRLGGLTVHASYGYYDVPWILGGKDLGIVPSVWWDNAPQTVFELQACGLPVLGANLGGIPDFVRDGHNGLLFRGNDRYDLARVLGEVVREPWKLFDLRRNVRPPKDISDHAGEMERLYQEGLESLGPGIDAIPALPNECSPVL